MIEKEDAPVSSEERETLYAWIITWLREEAAPQLTSRGSATALSLYGAEWQTEEEEKEVISLFRSSCRDVEHESSTGHATKILCSRLQLLVDIAAGRHVIPENLDDLKKLTENRLLYLLM